MTGWQTWLACIAFCGVLMFVIGVMLDWWEKRT